MPGMRERAFITYKDFDRADNEGMNDEQELAFDEFKT